MSTIIQSVNEYLTELGYKTFCKTKIYNNQWCDCIDIYLTKPGLFASIYHTGTTITIDLSWDNDDTPKILDIAKPDSLQELLDLLATCPTSSNPSTNT